MLRNGPFGSFGIAGPESRPPHGQGSLSIEVAAVPGTPDPFSEKIDFGNEVDFLGTQVSGLNQVGFHVFQTDENISYGGVTNMPNIAYSTLVWVPSASP